MSGNNKVSQLILRRRKALNLTRRQLAERAQITVNYIYKLENGLRKPTLETLHKIALALNVKPSKLVDLSFHELLPEIQTTLSLLEKEHTRLSRRLRPQAKSRSKRTE